MKFENIQVAIQKKELAYADLLQKKSKRVIGIESNFLKAIDHINNSLLIYKKHKIYDKVKDLYNNLNEYLNQYNKIESAKKWAIDALSYFEAEIKNCPVEDEDYSKLKTGIANSYANHGIALTREENFEQAIYYFSLSSSVYEDYGNLDQQTQLYINLAGVNKVVGNFNQAIHYLNKSLTNASQTSDSKNIYNNIVLQLGNLYIQQKNFKKSLDFFEKSLLYADARVSLNKFSMNVYFCIAQCYLELSEEKKCIENLGKATQLNEQAPGNLYGAHITLLKGRLLLLQGSFEEAIPYLVKCLKTNNGICVKTIWLACVNAIFRFNTEASAKQSHLLEEVLRKNDLPNLNELIKTISEEKIEFYNIHNFINIFETLSIYYEKKDNYKEAFKYNRKTNLLYDRLIQKNIDDQVDAVHQNFNIHLLEKKIETEVSTKIILHEKNTELETKVRQRTEKLQKQNDQLTEFINIVAHDLKEPARQIYSHVDFFKEQIKGKLNEEETLLVGNVLVNAERLILMMDDLIVYSFLREDKSYKPIDAGQLVNALIKTYTITQDDTDITVNLENLPVVKMSSNHLTQILRRLIDNAIKFKSTKRPLQLRIGACKKNQQHYICVTDNGIGFYQKQATHALKIFKKLNGNTYPGNGIGLAICKKIIELYNLTIEIETEPDKGTTVSFSVPV